VPRALARSEVRMTVARGDLEVALDALRGEIHDSRAGLFGPRSEVWRLQRESIVFLGAGRAALLQLAHPFIGQAIAEHSETTVAPHARFVRTFERVFAMVFGDLEHALRAARATWGVHRTIQGAIPDDVGSFVAGTPYEANAEPAIEWVNATLWDTSVRVHELVLGPIPYARKEAYWQETKRFAMLFGLSRDRLPGTWLDFQAYVERMLASATISVSPAARRISDFLLHPPSPALAPLAPLTRGYAALTAKLLPPRLRAQFGLPFGAFERALVATSIPMIRTAYRTLPESLRTLPPYRAAMRRVSGESHVPALDRLIGHFERLAVELVRSRAPA
jgi:uncharacterized protein (DUF2236 family)